MRRLSSRRAVFAVAGATGLAVALAAQGLRPADVNALPSKPADAIVSYGPDPLQFGELRLPKGSGPFPVAVVIHGGCWVSTFATLQNTAALSDALRDAGVATWNVEYRRLDNPGGGWPGTFTDVGAAADRVRELAAKYPLDLGRVISVGHSAGGHLALWLAARPRLPASSPLYQASPLRLRAAVSLGGPGDLRGFGKYAQNICGAPVIDQLMGGSPEAVSQRYKEGSPIELLPFGVRQLLIVGESDGVMPAQARDDYVAAARKSGDTADVAVVLGSHFEVIAPTSAAWPTVRDRILALVAPGR
jgi:acetyl esterase/lipase